MTGGAAPRLALQRPGLRRRRCRESPDAFSPSWKTLGIVVMSLLVGASADPSCRDVLGAADRNRDSFLDQTEFVAAVKSLSETGTQDRSKFNQLPELHLEAFDELACHCERETTYATCCDTDEVAVLPLPGLSSSGPLSSSRQQKIDAVCRRIRKSINAIQVMRRPPRFLDGQRQLQTNDLCFSAMEDSDLNDDDLMSQREYLIFINILSGNAYLGLTFAELPLELRRNYFTLRDDSNQINIFGSKEGDVPTPEESANLDNICTSTVDALNSLLPPTEAPTSAPTPAPSPSGATLPPLPEQTCLNAMAVSDLNNDNYLNQVEYTIFINLMSDNAWIGLTFAQLPLAFRRNYFQLRDPDRNQIYIFGAKPSQTPDLDQRINLNLICDKTQVAIEENIADAPTSAPSPGEITPTLPTASPTTSAPVVTPTTPAPVVTPTTAAPTTTAPTPGPTGVPTSSPSVVPTTGPSAGPSIQPTAPPTPEPSISPSTLPSNFPSSSPTESGFTGDLVIENSFLMSNRAGLTAEDLDSGPNRQSLDNAYADVVSNVTQALDKDSRRMLRSRGWRRRRLTVDYVSETATIRTIVDTECPSNLPFTAICQISTGVFNLSVAFEDREDVILEYTTAMDVAIDNGFLQDALPDASPLTIEGTVDGNAPTSAPTDQGGGSSSDGLSTGAIIGIVLAVTGGLALAGGGWYYMRSRRSGASAKLKPSRDSIPPPIAMINGDREGPPRDDGYPGERRSLTQTAQESPGSLEDSLFDSPEQDRNRFSPYGEEDSSFEESAAQSPFSPRDENASQLDDYQYDEPTTSRRQVAGVRSQDTSEGSSGWDDSESDSESSDSESEYTSPSDQDFRESAGAAAAAAGVMSVNAAPEETSDSESSSTYDDSTAESPATTPDPPSGDNSAAVTPASAAQQGGEYENDSYTTSNDSTYEDSEHTQRAGSVASPASEYRPTNFNAARPSRAAPPSGSADEGGIGTGGAAAIGVAAGAVGGAALMAATRRKKEEPEDSPEESKAATDADDLESLVEQRDWDGIIATAERFEQEAAIDTSGETTGESANESFDGANTHGESAVSSRPNSSATDSEYDSGSDSEGSSSSEDEDYTTDYTRTTATETPAETQRREEYKAEVEALVSVVVPEEMDNVDVMMEQFRDREEELISTLRTMQERSVTQRARAAVHKSRTRPVRQSQLGTGIRDSTYSINSRDTGRSDNSRGSAAGAAIAAASVPRPASGRMPIHPPTVRENQRSDSPMSPSTTTTSDSDLLRRSAPMSDSSPVSTSESDSYTSTSESDGTRDLSEKAGSLDDLPSRWKESSPGAAPMQLRQAPRQDVSKSKPWLKDEDTDSEEEEHPSISIGGN